MSPRLTVRSGAVSSEPMLYDEGGTGAPILLLHGLMGSARTWADHLPWLRAFGHVYTFDAAGHGRPAPPRPTTEAFVADLAEATARIPEPMVVIGHSMGGLHGWMFAATHPGRCERWWSRIWRRISAGVPRGTGRR